MGLFSSEAPCDGCGIPFAKKALNDFDATWRGERASDDARRRLCEACLSAALAEYFRGFTHRALVIEPTKEPRGYSFAPLDIPLKFFTWTDELRDQVRSLLPDPAAVCSRCGLAARFQWCGLDIFEGSPYELSLRERGSFREESLCGTCVAKAFDQAFRGSGTILREVLPPADGDGVLTPAEY